MRRMHRIVLLVGMVALAPVLAGCEDFDMDKFDVFHLNEKKKLPGERKDVFPQGVPGVTQGIPPEYMKGNQPQPDAAQAPAPAAAAATPSDKTAAPAPSAKTAAIEPAAEQAETEAQAEAAHGNSCRPRKSPFSRRPRAKAAGSSRMAPWPATTPQQPASGQSTSTDPWPSAPPPGTFSR